jgi:two-component system phosphate regulon sensor histidine kinase PhoR
VAVCANQRQLHDLCANLIENAVKYNVPGGSVSISLKAEGITAVFSISDTGIGIPERHQSRVFERFFRVDSGREKKIGGTGLGLSIVKHITNLYGGEISLESEEGKGTRIEVRLPVAVATEEDTFLK